MPEQIYNQFVLKTSLPSEADKKMVGATPSVCSMYTQLTSTLKHPHSHHQLSVNVVVCGLPVIMDLKPVEQIAIEECLGRVLDVGHVRVQHYKRFIVNRAMYHTLKYKQSPKCSNYTFMSAGGLFWDILSFISLKVCGHGEFCDCRHNNFIIARQLGQVSQSVRGQ